MCDECFRRNSSTKFAWSDLIHSESLFSHSLKILRLCFILASVERVTYDLQIQRHKHKNHRFTECRRILDLLKSYSLNFGTNEEMGQALGRLYEPWHNKLESDNALVLATLSLEGGKKLGLDNWISKFKACLGWRPLICRVKAAVVFSNLVKLQLDGESL